MASVDDLEWSDCDELLEDLLKNPKVELPQLIKLSQDITSINEKENLTKGQVILIHDKRTIAKLAGNNSKNEGIRLPVECPYNVTLKIPPGKEKNFDSIATLGKTDPLPKFVEVTSVEGFDLVSVGDRLKVVIAEKSGGIPSFVHFRSSAGKHVKISVDNNVTFKLAVNDASEQLLSKIAEKSRELPVAAQFVDRKDVPVTHKELGVFTITKGFTEQVVIASAFKTKDDEYLTVFPLSSHIAFQVNSKLKMANDKDYRELCTRYSNVEVSDVIEFLNIVNPADKETLYVVKEKKLKTLLSGNYESDVSSSDTEKTNSKKKNKLEKSKHAENSESDYEEKPEKPEKVDRSKFNTLTRHQDQQEIIKKEQKERERLAKIEKERLKAERKREKKEKKERDREEKRSKKKSIASQKSVSDVPDGVPEDTYIVPNSPPPSNPASPTPTSPTDDDDNPHQPQWALHLMSKVKNVRDRTKSLGFKPKKRNKLRKEDISYCSTDNITNNDDSIYTGLQDDAFEDESLYETLPCDMAYESLDLIQQARRTLAPRQPTEGADSGFDEIDQAKIKEWRDSMMPPPLPGNHPHQKQINQSNNNDEDIYEVAVDSGAAKNLPESVLKNFYSLVEQSTKEISTWAMEDVSACLQDLKLGRCKQTFLDSHVDGQLLLDLDESVLKDLGLSLFEARKLRKFVYGWRPDGMRPLNYPELKGFTSKEPSDWNVNDVIAHLKVIDVKDVAEFCQTNQVNGELLKDICVDDTIMNSIITTRDRKLKIVKIKNYVIDQWRPKQKGEGNYMTYTAATSQQSPALHRSPTSATSQQSPALHRSATTATSQQSPALRRSPKNLKSSVSVHSSSSSDSPSQERNSPISRTVSSPSTRGRKVSENNAPLGLGKKAVGGDAPLIARMKQQLEENSQNWHSKKQ